MLTSAQATAAVQNIKRLTDVPVAEANQAYWADVANIETEWKAWLRDEHGDGLNDATHNAVFGKAWADGHSSGYHEIEYHYQEIAELARTILKANR